MFCCDKGSVNSLLCTSAVFALGFFALEDLMVLLMLFDNYQSLSYKSLALKIPSAGLAVATTVARCIHWNT